MTNKQQLLSYIQLNTPDMHEDGTYRQVVNVITKHPTLSPFVVKRACRELEDYIHFCMNHSVEYWSIDQQAYVAFPSKDERIDYEDQRLALHSSYASYYGVEQICLNDEVDSGELRRFLRMSKDFARFRSHPTEEEMERGDRYGFGRYEYLLANMLDGNFY